MWLAKSALASGVVAKSDQADWAAARKLARSSGDQSCSVTPSAAILEAAAVMPLPTCIEVLNAKDSIATEIMRR